VEVSSGTDDDMPEELRTGRLNSRWSVMGRGAQPTLNTPDDQEYIPFSIEEVTTIEFNNIETID